MLCEHAAIGIAHRQNGQPFGDHPHGVQTTRAKVHNVFFLVVIAQAIQTPSCPTKIISKTITKSSVKLKVDGLGAGKVTVTGRGVKKTTKTIAKSTVATISIKRTMGKPGKVTVSFDPAGPAKARKATK